jgi:hypothetical protein
MASHPRGKNLYALKAFDKVVLRRINVFRKIGNYERQEDVTHRETSQYARFAYYF